MDGIKIEVTGNIARVTDRPARLTSGMVGLPVEFTFDSHWDGLSKTAVFRAGKTELIAEGLETGTTVPWEVLDKPNVWLSIGVYGASADGTIVIPTIWANVCLICEGVNPDGDVSTAPTLPVWQRLVNAVGNLLGLTTNAKDNLVDAINEVHNIAQAGGIESDPTLSQSGKAADAKVTGDVIQTHANDKGNPHKVTADQVGARPNTWTPTAEQVGAATRDDVKKANPVNLLDNSDFRNPVNQRGKTSYIGVTTSNVYTFDRWFLGIAHSENVINIISGGVEVVGVCTTYGANLRQYVPVDATDKTMTFAVCDTNGNIIIASGKPVVGSWIQTDTEWGFIGLQQFEGKLMANIRVTNGNAHAFRWVALYEGEYTAETLPEYHPKGYGAELAECMRYYQRFGYHSSNNYKAITLYCATDDTFYPLFSYHVPMRIENPTFKINGAASGETVTVRNPISGKSVTGTLGGWNNSYRDRLSTVTIGGNTGEIGYCYEAGIEVFADL